MEELILNKAKDLFFRYGLKTITMDDIAKASGVSKKTIYACFSSKNDILENIIKQFLACHQLELEKCRTASEDAVQEILNHEAFVLKMIQLVKPGFFYDVEKSSAALWHLVTEYRLQSLLPFFIKNLERGITEALYRDHLDLPLVAEIRVQHLMTAFDQVGFTNRKIQTGQLLSSLSAFYLHAIVTPKGKKLINKYLNVNNEKQFSN